MADLSDIKIRCSDCDWSGTYADALSVPHPFRADDTLYGCPDCKDIGPFAVLCEAAGCMEDGSNGRTVPGLGYMRLCHEHWTNPPTTASVPLADSHTVRPPTAESGPSVEPSNKDAYCGKCIDPAGCADGVCYRAWCAADERRSLGRQAVPGDAELLGTAGVEVPATNEPGHE